MKGKNYDELAVFIIEHVGGRGNIVALTHCITRLRFQLADESKADTAALKDKSGVIDVIQRGGQYQVVIGNDVEPVYDAVLAQGGGGAAGDGAGESGASGAGEGGASSAGEGGASSAGKGGANGAGEGDARGAGEGGAGSAGKGGASGAGKGGASGTGNNGGGSKGAGGGRSGAGGGKNGGTGRGGAASDGLFNRLIATISGIFTPLLGLMCGCGILKGLSVFLGALGLLHTGSGTYVIINSIGDTIFYFFPMFIGYTAAEKFGMNKFVGMAVGASLIHPNVAALKSAEAMYTVFAGTLFESHVTTTFMGIPVLLMNYASTVIPAILAVYFGSKVEAFFKKIIPTVVKMFLVPALTLLVIVPVTLLAVGPVATWISDLIGAVFMGVYEFSPVLTGALVGGLWQVLVMFGLHQGITPIMINNLMTNGYEAVICCMQAVPFVTCAVVFAVFLKTKNKKTRETALPAAISSFFGVSEPSIYGVTLPLKTPFFITLGASAIGGALMGLFGVKMYTMGGMGLFAFPAYINPEAGFDMSFYGVLISVGVAMVIGFVTTMVLFKDKTGVEVEDPKAAKAKLKERIHGK